MGHTLVLGQSLKPGIGGEVLFLVDEMVAMVTILKDMEPAYPCAWLAFLDLFIGC